MQEQASRQSQRNRDTEAVKETTEHDRSRTDEVIEEANCCLADIDAALAEHEAEESDAEVYAKGHPEWRSFYFDDEYVDHEDARAAWMKAHNRYAKAYEMLTGVVHQCGCGGCGSAINGYDGDGRGGGFEG